MANNWAIAIGINQYHFFQPLGCAQADAEALKDFLVTEGGFLPQKCLLLTDSSSPLGDRPTIPTKENILLLLEDLAAACWQPQDRLWFFFSGYGVNYNGRDYLMPVEGSPDQVEETGIELRRVLEILQVSALNALVLLDINRAFGTQASTFVGQETIELARLLKVPTILSCQPEQFSHESSDLGHGFFTAALLEALRSGNGSTLVDLEKYLSICTPELCQHHWRPTQNPVTVASKEQVILPQLEVKTDWEDISLLSLEEILPPAIADPQVQSSHAGKSGAVGGDHQATSLSSSSSPPTLHYPLSTPGTPISPISTPPIANNFQYKGTDNSPYWQMFLLWGATTMLLLCLISVVLFGNKAGLRVQEIPASPKTTTSEIKLDKPLPVAKFAPLQNRQSTSELQASSEAPQQNQALLDLEKMSLKPNQASDLGLAIATAGRVKPGEPFYKQAQEDIKIWSRMILDLAQVRAKQGQYENAIAAAQLIRQEDALYPKAQASLNQWRLETKKYMSNETLLDAANALIQPGQAFTYNRAIIVAKKVPPDEPGFDNAQKLINQWSQNILDVSTRRAAQGEFKAAIETAALVPEGTNAYKQAQEAIQKWQKK